MTDDTQKQIDDLRRRINALENGSSQPRRPPHRSRDASWIPSKPNHTDFVVPEIYGDGAPHPGIYGDGSPGGTHIDIGGTSK